MKDAVKPNLMQTLEVSTDDSLCVLRSKEHLIKLIHHSQCGLTLFRLRS